MSFTIRQAKPADAIALAQMRYEFRSTVGSTRVSEMEFVRYCERWMAERLDDNGAWWCWVAENGTHVVGNIWLQLIDKIPNPADEPECLGYITNLFVKEQARRHGLGSRLLATALDCCTEHNADAVILWSTEMSRHLYLKRGFATHTDLLQFRVSTTRDSF